MIESCPNKTIEMRLIRGKEYLDEVSGNDIANLSDVPVNVHFRDDHVRLEGVDLVLYDKRFDSHQFTLQLWFGLLQDLTRSIDLVNLPLGKIVLQHTETNKAQVRFEKDQASYNLTDVILLRSQNYAIWHQLVVSHNEEEISTNMSNT